MRTFKSADEIRITQLAHPEESKQPAWMRAPSNKTNKKTYSMRRVLARFAAYQSDKARLARASIGTNCGYIRQTMCALGVARLTEEQCRAAIERMILRNHSPRSINNAISAFQHYAKMHRLNLQAKRPHNPKTLPSVFLTEGQVAAVLEAAHTLRVKAIVAVLAYTGLTCQELCRLRVRDFEQQGLRVRHGRRSGRMPQLGSDCTGLLTSYICEEGKEGREYLFNVLGTRRPLKPANVAKIVRVAGRRAKLPMTLTAKLLRDSLASHLYARSGDKLLVRQQLGHKFYSTTEHFLKALHQEHKNVYESVRY